MLATTLCLHSPSSPPAFTPSSNSCKPGTLPHNLLQIPTRRRASAMAALATVFLAQKAASTFSAAAAFDLRVTTPDQTLEEAEAGVRFHAQQLLDIKLLIDLQSWKEAQKALRESSSYLKQDIYTIIQAKPGSQRPQLRKLYSRLFNSVTSLDYAARDGDSTVVQECYNNIVESLNEFFGII